MQIYAVVKRKIEEKSEDITYYKNKYTAYEKFFELCNAIDFGYITNCYISSSKTYFSIEKSGVFSISIKEIEVEV